MNPESGYNPEKEYEELKQPEPEREAQAVSGDEPPEGPKNKIKQYQTEEEEIKDKYFRETPLTQDPNKLNETASKTPETMPFKKGTIINTPENQK